MSSAAIFSVLGYALLLTVPVVLAWALNRRRRHGVFRKHGIPGPDPDLFGGNWKQLKRDRLQVMQQWIDRYGKVFGFFMAEKPCLVVTDLDLVRQIFVKEAHTFIDRAQVVLEVEPFNSSLAFLRGEEWKKVRTVLNAAITAGKVNRCSGIVSGCAKELVRVIEKNHERDEPVDVVDVAEGYSLDVITKCALAWKANCQHKSDDTLLLGLRRILEDLDSTVIESTLALPGVRSILKRIYPLTSVSKTFHGIAENVHDTINKRRQGQSPREDDMLQMLLDAQAGVEDKTYNVQKSDLLLEDRHVIGNSIVLLAAGFDTTATTIKFTLYLLAENPDEQEKVHSEIDAVLPYDDEISLNSIQNLKRLDMVINESLRLYPPVPILIARLCPRDMTVRDQFIPAGTSVFAPAWHIHRDPESWPEPARFLPDRFAEDHPERHPLAFIPFGLGPRSCFGKRLALLEVKMALCEILREYRVIPSEETVDPIPVTVPNLLLRPVGGIKLKFESKAER
ncbi:cytochrome P450 3A4 [Ixodes scapularis]|uniref:cytochrome P450 3A4 n=1 Tax=Ixodes scapularis TaxID=6945 RepID=UPI001A9FF2C6|nr:cytochrome P450 3A4 [Ixodes scapularis]